MDDVIVNELEVGLYPNLSFIIFFYLSPMLKCLWMALNKDSRILF